MEFKKPPTSKVGTAAPKDVKGKVANSSKGRSGANPRGGAVSGKRRGQGQKIVRNQGMQDGPGPSNDNTKFTTEAVDDQNKVPGPSRPVPESAGKHYVGDPMISGTDPMLYPQPFEDEVNMLHGLYLNKRAELDEKGVVYGDEEDIALRRVAESLTSGFFSKVLEFRADMY